jgi:hypothetical protein
VTSGGASTTTQSANGTLLDQTVTTNTPQSSGGLVTSVTTSALDNGAFIATVSQTTTISNAGGTATTTVVNDSANGTLLSKSTSTLGSAARTVTIFGNGDGAVTQSEVVAVNGATTTDTVENLNADTGIWCRPKKTRRRRKSVFIPLRTADALELDCWAEAPIIFTNTRWKAPRPAHNNEVYLYPPRGAAYTETSLRARWHRWLGGEAELAVCVKWRKWLTEQIAKYE